jgi:two-component system, cell cycle sensor histidine kinase and response regulator CckA
MTFAAAPLSPAEVRPSPPSPTILVVEDDPAVRRVLVLWLESLGHDVLTAGNGAEALEVICERHDEIDLIVSDVIMPVMSGRRLFETLRRRGYEHPLLFVTGYCKDALHDLGIIGHDADVLQKPCDFAIFADKVQAMLAAAVPAAA